MVGEEELLKKCKKLSSKHIITDEMTIINIRNVLPHFSSISVALPAQPDFWKSGQPGTPYGKKQLFQRVKPKNSCPTFFCGFGIHIKNTFCKKIGPKQSI